MPDTAGSEKHKQTSLWGIARAARYNKKHRFRNLYGMLTLELLHEGWLSLNKKATSGVDKVTAADYSKNLENNLLGLWTRLKSKRYKAKLVRRKYIPKEGEGKERPLGIPAIEDKIVQSAVAKILNAIYEADFLNTSYAYRPKRGAKDAVSDLTYLLQFGVFGYVVEADIKGFYDNIDHGWLLRMLSLRINDKAFLKLIQKWLKAGILNPDGTILHPVTGCPQGGIVSPILANVYLHYVLDLWFEKVVKSHLKGQAIICRYADDWVCAFRYQEDAEKFFKLLPERLAKFQLEIESSKTRILRFSRFHPGMDRVFKFLGFEFYWFPDRNGTNRVMRRTARKKLHAAIQRIKEWIKSNRHLPIRELFKELNAKLIGHYNYYGVTTNSRSLWSFFGRVKEIMFKWLNRRSQRKSCTWEKFKLLMERLRIARPRITERKRLHQVCY